MKPILYILLFIATVFYCPQTASAGFFVKHHVVANTGTQAVAQTEIRTIATASKSPSQLQSVYNNYNRKEWYGVASMIAAVLGLLIPGMNFLAILFGALGMGRRSKAQGLVIAGFVIGMLELVLFLATSSTLVALILF